MHAVAPRRTRYSDDPHRARILPSRSPPSHSAALSVALSRLRRPRCRAAPRRHGRRGARHGPVTTVAATPPPPGTPPRAAAPGSAPPTHARGRGPRPAAAVRRRDQGREGNAGARGDLAEGREGLDRDRARAVRRAVPVHGQPEPRRRRAVRLRRHDALGRDRRVQAHRQHRAADREEPRVHRRRQRADRAGRQGRLHRQPARARRPSRASRTRSARPC